MKTINGLFFLWSWLKRFKVSQSKATTFGMTQEAALARLEGRFELLNLAIEVGRKKFIANWLRRSAIGEVTHAAMRGENVADRQKDDSEINLLRWREMVMLAARDEEFVKRLEFTLNRENQKQRPSITDLISVYLQYWYGAGAL